MSASPCATALWKAILDNEPESTEDQKAKKWKISAPGHVDCDVCDEPGGVLICCNAERCWRYFHLDCAFQVEGLYLSEEGILTCFCERHNRPPLFCTCKQKYDNTRPMIFCDSCSDWFHPSCEHLKSEIVEDESYICVNCSVLQRSGKSVSAAIKQKNKEKEDMSMAAINATETISKCTTVTSQIAPIIDSITGQSSEPVTLVELEEVVESLNEAPWSPAASTDEPSDMEDKLRSIGVLDITSEWLNLTNSFIQKWMNWKEQVVRVVETMGLVLSKDLNEQIIDELNIFKQPLEELENTYSESFRILKEDVSAAMFLFEYTSWLQEFLQAFFNPAKSDNWSQQMSGMNRTMLQKLKKLSQMKRDELTDIIATCFKPFAATVDSTLSIMLKWHNAGMTVVSDRKSTWSVDEVRVLLAESEYFPTKVPLQETLAERIAFAEDITQRFEVYLSQEQYVEAEFRALDDEKTNAGLVVPFEAELNLVHEYGVFLKAYEISLAEKRIHVNIALALIESGEDAQASVESTQSHYPIVRALEEHVRTAITFLKSAIADADAFKSGLTYDQLDSLETSALAEFQNLTIITVEEEWLVFCQDYEDVHGRVKAIREKQVKVDFPEVEPFAEKIKALFNYQEPVNVTTAVTKKMDLREDLHYVLELHNDADIEWSRLQNVLHDAKNGLSVTSEVVYELLHRSEALPVTHIAVSNMANELLQIGQTLTEQCESRLHELQECTLFTVQIAHDLVEQIKHNVVPTVTSGKLKLRYDTLKIVQQCHTLMNQAHDVDSANMNRLSLLRETKHAIVRLEEQLTESSFERTLLHTVKDQFLSMQWREELKDIFQSSIATSTSHAVKLAEEAELIGNSLTSTTEYCDLKQAIIDADQIAVEIKSAYDETITLLTSLELEPKYFENEDITSLSQSTLLELSKWKEVSVTVHQQHTILQAKLQGAHIVQDEAQGDLHQWTFLLDVLNNATIILNIIQNGFVTRIDGNAETPLSPPNGETKQITDSIAAFMQLSNDVQQSPLLQNINLTFETFNKEMNAWIEKHRDLIPQFFTRQRSRPDIKLPPKSALLAALNEPIAQAIKTSLHPRFIQVWNDTIALRVKIRNFLLSGNSMALNGENKADAIRNGVILLEGLVNEMESIPLEIPEAPVLRWAQATMYWLERIPRPDSSDIGLEMEEMESSREFAHPLIVSLQSSLIRLLIELGVMTGDENGTPTGFAPDVHSDFKILNDYLNYLERHISIAERFHEKVESVLSAEHTTAEVEALVAEKDKLVILPDRKCVRDLDRALESEKRRKAPTGTVRHKPLLRVEPKKSHRNCAAKGCTNRLRLPIQSSFCNDTCAVNAMEEVISAIMEYKANVQEQRKANAVGVQVVGLGSVVQGEDVKAFDVATRKSSSTSTDDGEMRGIRAGSFLHEMTQRLPTVATKVLRLEKVDNPKTASDEQKEQALRQKVRANIEDILTVILIKAKVDGGPVMGALLGMEIEQAMFDKHQSAQNVEYQRHYRLLSTNIRRPNNEALMVRVAKGELAVKELMVMTAKEFADTEQQQQRRVDVQVIMSTDQQFENRRREIMAGDSEGWRDGGFTKTNTDSDNKVSAIDAPPALQAANASDGNHEITAMDVDMPMTPTDTSGIGRGVSMEEDEVDVRRAEEIEERVKAKASSSSGLQAVGGKRPPDVDAGTRFTTNREKKPRLEITTETDNARTAAVPSPSPKESPRPGLKLIDMLKAHTNVGSIQASTPTDTGSYAFDNLNDDDEEVPAATMRSRPESNKSRPPKNVPSPSSATKPVSQQGTPSMKLLNKEGSEYFTITKPGGIMIKTSAIVNEKKVQGLIKPMFNIDGRSRIADTERFVNEVLALGKKCVATVVFLVVDPSPEAGNNYLKLCDEFGKAEKVGLCSISDAVQLYLVPPRLQYTMTILKDVKMNLFGAQDRYFLGIIVAKESASTQYLNRPYATLPLAPSSFSGYPNGAGTPVAAMEAAAVSAPISVMMSNTAPRPALATKPGPSTITGTSAGWPATVPSANAVPYTPPIQEQMRQVAEICAKLGPQKLEALRTVPVNRFHMPFLFEGNPGYTDFRSMIIEIARQPQPQIAPQAASMQQPFIGGNMPRPFVGGMIPSQQGMPLLNAPPRPIMPMSGMSGGVRPPFNPNGMHGMPPQFPPQRQGPPGQPQNLQQIPRPFVPGIPPPNWQGRPRG